MSAVDARRDRAVGCLLGLAIGDAVGTTLEFKARDTYEHLTDMVGGGPFQLRPGEWTDDTSMALCLADSLLAYGRLEPADLATRFLRWRREGHNSVTGRCFDIGVTTAEALDRFRRTGEPLSGSSDPATAGNGSIMRLAPVALFHASDEAKAVEAAILQSRITHAAPEALDSCAMLARVLVQLIAGRGRGALVQDPASYRSSKVREIAAGVWRAKSRAAICSSGYVIDTLEAALWAVEQTNSFRDAVLLAANLGHDADTVGAVTGQIAGALYGLSGIPNEWVERLAWRKQFEEIATKLVADTLP